jgi:hypothetical protein
MVFDEAKHRSRSGELRQAALVKVILSRNAERDLEEIGDWIAQDNPDRAT